MNKKLHFLLFCFSLIVIIYLCREKLFKPYGGSSVLEPFGNQIVIHPDNASFEPQETTFSVLTYDSDLGSGVTQVSTCSDDSSWRNGDKTCRDYSLDGTNCEDIGSDGRLAFDACKVACDNCNTYTEVKRRLPSPIEDTDEPSYAQFEGSMISGDTGLDIGGPDYREIIEKLDDLSGKIDLIEVSGGSTEDGGDTVDAICVATDTSVDEDVNACAAVTELSDSSACEAVITAADSTNQACTYTTVSADIQNQLTDIQSALNDYINEPGIPQDEVDQFTEIQGQIIALTGMIETPGTRIMCTDIVNFACEGGTELIEHPEHMTITDSTDPQDICCTVPPAEPPGGMQTCAEVDCLPDREPRTFGPGNMPTFSGLTSSQILELCCTTPYSGSTESTNLNACTSVNCEDATGYNPPSSTRTLDADQEANPQNCCEAETCESVNCEDATGYNPPSSTRTLDAGVAATLITCCDKTGYCSGNLEPNNNITCMWPFHTDIDEKDKMLGQNFSKCCENRWWRLIIFGIISYIVWKLTGPYIDKTSYKVYLGASLLASAILLGTDSIPRFIIWHNTSKWTGYGDDLWGMDGGGQDKVVWPLVIVCVVVIVLTYINEIASAN